MPPDNSTEQNRRIVLILLFTILVLAFSVRLFNIGERSYWLDEVESLRLAKYVPTHLTFYWQSETHPPLYYLLLNLWISIFGDSEASTRLLSTFFGVLCVFLIYKLGTVLFNSQTGLLSALLLSLCTFHVAHSQETRMYSLLALLTLISVYYFVVLIRNGGKVNTVLYLCSSFLLLYIHFYGIFVLIAQNIFILFCMKKTKMRIRKWIILQLIIGLVFLPWIIVIFLQSQAIYSGAFVGINWIQTPNLLDLIHTLNLFAGSPLLLICLLILAAFALLKKEKKTAFATSIPNKKFLLILFAAVPILLPFIISLITIPFYESKYAISASVFFYILAAKGLSELKPRIKSVLIGVLLALLLFSMVFYYNAPSDEPWRDVAAYIDLNAKTYDQIIVTPSFVKRSLERYLHKEIVDENIFENNSTVIWLVIRAPAKEFILKEYCLNYSKQFGNITISKYQKEQLCKV